MTAQRDTIARWVASEILPHEVAVRRWLARSWGAALDVDDVVQEAYCRIAALGSIEHIENGRAYFFATARSIAADTFRRSKVAGAKAMTEIELCDVEDASPRADRSAEARQELLRIDRFLSTFSLTCRRVIELRRLQGLSQRETAERLGISEHSVENHVTRGIRRVMKMLADEDAAIDNREAASLDGN
ncbi:RNA polymerase sigma factor [Novosphingobium soli]|uniref:RNA polymerase sigma factor n=1 Tax=Novosphingobium soli TaxID=574956 RepID=A0ABV6CZE5_9SPHN